MENKQEIIRSLSVAEPIYLEIANFDKEISSNYKNKGVHTIVYCIAIPAVWLVFFVIFTKFMFSDQPNLNPDTTRHLLLFLMALPFIMAGVTAILLYIISSRKKRHISRWQLKKKENSLNGTFVMNFWYCRRIIDII